MDKNVQIRNHTLLNNYICCKDYTTWNVLYSQYLCQCWTIVFQALIYPLTVASKSAVTARQNAANKILKNMREHSNTLVQQAILVMVVFECRVFDSAVVLM